MLSISGPKALMLLQLLIALVTWYVVNVSADVNDFGGPTEGACSMSVPAMSTRPSDIQMHSTHPAIIGRNSLCSYP